MDRVILSSHRWFGLLLVACGSLLLAFGARAESAPPPAVPAALRCDWSGQEYDDFYEPPPLGDFDPQRLGEILRLEHLRTFTPEEVARTTGLAESDYGAEVYRILYLSQAPLGTPQAVSALVAVPAGTAPEEGFPLLVHGHGTTGMADQCAPSQRALSTWDLLPWVADGYMVAATDYAGLGTPGMHPYGVGDVAAYGMLDSARAALNFCDGERGLEQPAANRLFLEGHSQGGHSALFAQELWPTYAPELAVQGTVAFAPGGELRTLAEETATSNWSARLAPLALALHAYTSYYDATEPLQTWLQEPYASELPAQADNLCLPGLMAWFGFRPAQVFQPEIITALQAGEWDNLYPFTSYVDANTPGNFKSDVPVLLLQGELDALIPTEITQQLAERLCSNGTQVTLNRYAGLGHATVAWRTRAEALAWMEARLEGKALANSCGEGFVPPLARDLDPAILSGEELDLFQGLPIDELGLYSYDGWHWRPIPFQIDEITAGGVYTATEDGLLDSNDELVFMVRDAGYQALGWPFLTYQLPISPAWYEVEVADEGVPAQRGWVYLVHLPQPEPGSPVDYVSFNPLIRRVRGETYTLGFPSFLPAIDYLSLGAGGPDILDRTKVSLQCEVPLICPVTEEKLSPTPNNSFVKDGPVRAILQEGRVMAYGSMLSWSRTYTIPANLEGPARVSTDFSPAAAGATFYNMVVPQGIDVDGVPDSVLENPVSPWGQLTTADGTLLQVTDLETLGGGLANYYVDNASVLLGDTGDQMRYGDNGLVIATPTPTLQHRFTWYLPPDPQPNLGETYAYFYQHPLTVSALAQQADGPPLRTYLPVMRGR